MNAKAMKPTLSLLLAAAFLFQGCGSTPTKIAYQTLSATDSLVDNAMKAAGQARKIGQLNDQQWGEVKKAYAKYQTAFATACDIAAYDFSSFTPSAVLTLANDVIATITSLGVKI